MSPVQGSPAQVGSPDTASSGPCRPPPKKKTGEIIFQPIAAGASSSRQHEPNIRTATPNRRPDSASEESSIVLEGTSPGTDSEFRAEFVRASAQFINPMGYDIIDDDGDPEDPSPLGGRGGAPARTGEEGSSGSPSSSIMS